MNETPCGCKLLDDAEAVTDERAREGLEALGKESAAKWRCPSYTGEECPSEASDEVRSTLVAVERLTGVGELTTCPCWYTLQPAVGIACNARKWAERGLLRERLGEPSLALMQSIEVIDAALIARDSAERKERERERKNGDNRPR